jgi:serine/threonine protein kinase/Flp pilus assembly protein TadD
MIFMAEAPKNDEMTASADLTSRDLLRDPFLGLILSDRYQLLELLDTGGFGRVYKARQLSLNMDLAVKILHHQHLKDEVSIKRFEKEAQLLSRVENPHVIRIIDFGLTPAPYLVMEYFAGTPLNKWIRANGPMQPETAVELFLQLGDAISAAETMHIVHRDLKPANILLRNDVEEVFCKILDFGVGKFADAEISGEHLTATGEILGSPAYMAPEQWKGQCDSRSDIYSLGCIMYEVLSGKPVFSAQFGMEYMSKHLSETPKSISQVQEAPGPPIPPALEAVVFKCLEKSPANRYQSMKQCIADLKALKTGTKLIDSLPEQPRATKSRIMTATAAIMFASVLGGLISEVLMNTVFRQPAQVVADKNKKEAARGEISIQPMAIGVGLKQRPEKWQGKTLRQWSQAIEQNPTDARQFFGRGMLHLYRREYGEAIHDFDRTVQVDPKFAEAYVERSVAFTANSQNAEYERALADANAAIALRPNWARGYFARALAYEWTEQNEPAIADSKKALELGEVGSEFEPSYLNNYDNLAVGYLNMGRLDEAGKVIELASKSVSPGSRWLVYRQRALVHCRRQEFSEAIKELDLAMKEPGCSPFAWALKAYCLAGLGKMDEAEEVWLQDQKKETGPPEAYRRRGEFWRTAGMTEQAIQDFSRVVWLEQSKNYFTLRLRALCYLEQGDLHEALADLQEAAALNAYSAKTLGLLAVVEDKLGESERAEKDIVRAFQLPTRPPILYVNRAAIELSAGELEKAVADLDLAISKDPFLKEAYALRKVVHEKLGKVKEAEADSAMSKKLYVHCEFIP